MSAQVDFEYFGGNCPVQGEGTINGVPFYFRARGQRWAMSIGEDPIGISCGQQEGWHRSEAWGEDEYAAGWMPRETARDIIFRCADDYSKEVWGC